MVARGPASGLVAETAALGDLGGVFLLVSAPAGVTVDAEHAPTERAWAWAHGESVLGQGEKPGWASGVPLCARHTDPGLQSTGWGWGALPGKVGGC